MNSKLKFSENQLYAEPMSMPPRTIKIQEEASSKKLMISQSHVKRLLVGSSKAAKSIAE